MTGDQIQRGSNSFYIPTPTFYVEGQLGFQSVVSMIFLLLVLAPIVFAYTSVAVHFPRLDPLSALFVVLMPVSMIVGAVFIELNKATITGGERL